MRLCLRLFISFAIKKIRIGLGGQGIVRGFNAAFKQLANAISPLLRDGVTL